MIGMKSEEDLAEKIFFIREVIVDTAESDAGFFSDVAHRGGTVTLLNKELISGMKD